MHFPSSSFVRIKIFNPAKRKVKFDYRIRITECSHRYTCLLQVINFSKAVSVLQLFYYEFSIKQEKLTVAINTVCCTSCLFFGALHTKFVPSANSNYLPWQLRKEGLRPFILVLSRYPNIRPHSLFVYFFLRIAPFLSNKIYRI